MIDLHLIPVDYRVALFMNSRSHRFVLIENDFAVCNVTSIPPDTEAFCRAVNRAIHERFDPEYDACRWESRS